MRIALLGCALAACASAGVPDHTGPADAPRYNGTDGAPPPSADAPVSIDAPAGVSCSSGAMCQGAMNLGSVSGDTGGAMLMASGYQSAWYRVRVTEDDSGIAGVALRMRARVTSPASTHFDVYAYVNSGSDVIECTTPSGTPTSSGTTSEIELTWGEGTIANGADDSRSVSIEVRPAGTTCAQAQTWQLVVLGNN